MTELYYLYTYSCNDTSCLRVVYSVFFLKYFNNFIITLCSCFPVFSPVLHSSDIDHHGGERHGRHLELCLPGGGVHGCGVARKPPPALHETRLGLHDGQLHQVPDCHLGVAHRPRVNLLPVLPPRIPLPVLSLHAEIQDPTGLCGI